jgi:hypothetical protein
LLAENQVTTFVKLTNVNFEGAVNFQPTLMNNKNNMSKVNDENLFGKFYSGQMLPKNEPYQIFRVFILFYIFNVKVQLQQHAPGKKINDVNEIFFLPSFAIFLSTLSLHILLDCVAGKNWVILTLSPGFPFDRRRKKTNFINSVLCFANKNGKLFA